MNNAGLAPISPLADLDTEGWSAMIDVNFRGMLNGVAAALPVFREQGAGHLVSIVSVAGLSVSPSMAVYAATKNAAGVLGGVEPGDVTDRRGRQLLWHPWERNRHVQEFVA